MTRAASPGRGSRSEWCTIRREPPGPPARLWQTSSSGRDCHSRTRARSSLERKFQGPSPPCQRDACSGNRRRTRRRKEPHKFLRQVASGASSETSMTRSGGSDPDRRRSLGFLTVQFHLPPCGGGRNIEGLGQRKRPKLQIFLVRGSVLRARDNRPPLLRFQMFRRLALA